MIEEQLEYKLLFVIYIIFFCLCKIITYLGLQSRMQDSTKVFNLLKAMTLRNVTCV